MTYVAVIGIYLALLPRTAQIFPAVPLLAERAVLLLALAWFVNLFNFMDGIAVSQEARLRRSGSASSRWPALPRRGRLSRFLSLAQCSGISFGTGRRAG